MVTFTLTKNVPLLLSVMGVAGLFGVHAAITFFAAIFSLIFLPETKDKSLSELCQIYAKQKEGPPAVGKDNLGADKLN